MNTVIIFTDGSSRGNPGPGGWGSIVASEDTATELGGGEKMTTNNRMELMAVIEAIRYAAKTFKNPSPVITVHTDSSYVLNSATKWVHGWKKNNWKTKLKDDVSNRDLWEEFLEVSVGLKLEWRLLKGHSGIPANERCDGIATSFADNEKIKLYKGSLSAYGVDLSVSKTKIPKAKTKSSSKKGVAYSYVSEISGVVKTHKTWAECEARTKGKSKARFKKVFSIDEEKTLIASWKKIS